MFKKGDFSLQEVSENTSHDEFNYDRDHIEEEGNETFNIFIILTII